MIVKNEEQTLKDCLSSVTSLVDEIIIVDTGSKDLTKQVAAQFTHKIFDFEWVDDFSAARNYSFSKASKDYTLWLDADDILLPDDIVKFKRLKESLSFETNVVMLKYNCGFDSEGKVNFWYFRERLVKTSARFGWKEPVHEYIETCGKTIKGDCCITHNKKPKKWDGRNIRIYEKLIADKVALSPRGNYYYARELNDAQRYKEAAQQFEIFLNFGLGWVEDNIEACCALYDCKMQLNDYDKALHYLFKSFEYDTPRPKACCFIGHYFKQCKLYNQAIYWFELAQNLNNPDTLGFIQKDYNGYIPCAQLAHCYYLMGDNKKYSEYFSKAAGLKQA